MSNLLFTDAHWQQACLDVEKLQQEFPQFKAPRLARQVIKSACLKAGATGAASTAVGLIPGFGKLLGWASSMLGDAAVTASLQRDMALRLFALEQRKPSAADAQYLTTLLSAVGIGGIQVAEHIGGGMLKSMARKVLGKFLRRGLPAVEVLGSSATHVIGTYLLAAKIQRYLESADTRTEITIDEPDARRLRNWTMLSLGTVVDDAAPKSVKDAFKE